MSGRIVVCIVVSSSLLALFVGFQAGRERWPDRQPPSLSRAGYEGALFGAVAGEVRAALLERDVLERSARLGRLLQRLGPESLSEVRAAYDSVFLDLGEIDLVLFADWWARFDPAEAFRWTEATWQASHPAVVRAVVHAWARRDPRAAVEAVRATDIGKGYLNEALRGWDESGEPGLLDFVEGLGPGHLRQRALYVVTRRRVLRDGPQKAFVWADGLPDTNPTFKLNAIRRVASAAAEVDPRAAAGYVDRHADGFYARGLPRRVATRWAKHDGAAALSWLSTLPAGANRDDGVGEAYRMWARHARREAMDWIAGQAFERWLEPAFSIYAMQVSKQDPRRALDEWATRLTDPELYSLTVGRIARRWLAQEERAARTWLDAADLPEKLRKKIEVIPSGIR